MKIIITGDFFVEHPESITIDDSVKQLMKSCDYHIVNLEGPITYTTTSEEPKKSGPRLKQTEGVVRLLEDLGTNMLTLANNHLMDYGEDGYRQTRTVLRGRYVLAGCGSWDDAYSLQTFRQGDTQCHAVGVCHV